jgi:hypothetical protein
MTERNERGHFRDGLAVDQGCARRRIVEAVHRRAEGRLAAPDGTYHRKDLYGRDFEVDALQNLAAGS